MYHYHKNNEVWLLRKRKQEKLEICWFLDVRFSNYFQILHGENGEKENLKKYVSPCTFTRKTFEDTMKTWQWEGRIKFLCDCFLLTARQKKAIHCSFKDSKKSVESSSSQDSKKSTKWVSPNCSRIFWYWHLCQ